jgi:hypothetical protein
MQALMVLSTFHPDLFLFLYLHCSSYRAAVLLQVFALAHNHSPDSYGYCL